MTRMQNERRGGGRQRLHNLAVVAVAVIAIVVATAMLAAGEPSLPVEAWRLMLVPALILLLLGAHFHTE